MHVVYRLCTFTSLFLTDVLTDVNCEQKQQITDITAWASLPLQKNQRVYPVE